MSCAVALWPVGKSNSTTMKVTHITATAPIGVDNFPKVNGPGTSLSRPDVIRRKIGAT